MNDYIKIRINSDMYDSLTEAEIPAKMQLFQEFIAWNSLTGGSLPPKGNLLMKGIGHDDQKSLPGGWLYKYYNENIITSIEGIDKLQHYVKKDIAWLNTVVDTKDILDENDNIIGSEEITNKEKYNISDSLTNATHCLVKLTDANFKDFVSELTFDNTGTSTNFFCNDKFTEEFEANFKVEQPEEDLI